MTATCPNRSNRHGRLRAFLGAGLMLWGFQAVGAQYYVSTGGNDGNPGTLAQPFRTIQKAAGVVTAGDTVYIRGGSYRETVTLANKSATSNAPIRFTAYSNEVVTLDGTISITSSWTQHSGNIYKTTLSEDIWQLFVNGEMMIMARWPNAFLHDGSIFDREGRWALGDANLGTNGVLVDTAHNGNDLAASGLNMTGAMGIMNVGSFTTWPRRVTSHAAGSSMFSYNPVPAGNYRDKHHYYYLEGKLDLLDAEREWFYEKSTKTLYLWATGGGSPSGDIRGKNRAYAFEVSNCDYIVLDGLNFWAATFRFSSSANCTVENCSLQSPSFSRRMLGSEANIELSEMTARSNSQPGNTVRNCVFENSDGSALEMSGVGCVVENNYFYRIDFSCAGIPGLGVSVRIAGSNARIRRNRLDTLGSSSTIQPGNSALTEFNRISNTGLLQSDGSCIHRTVPQTPGSITRFNWIHDSVKFAIRYDGDSGTDGLAHHNAVWNTGAMRIKGDWHRIYNNVGFDSRSSDGNINIDLEMGGNANTITRNNAAEVITDTPIPGTASNNYDASDGVGLKLMRALLRDPDNLDFRPRASAVELVDQGAVVAGITDGYLGAAPDIGAYEFGATNYWIAGRQRVAASTPIPPDGSITVKTNADLMWLEGLQATAHRVYFGTNPASLPFQGQHPNNIFSPGPLVIGVTYYWRVDEVTPSGTVTGAVWSFTVPLPDTNPPAVVHITGSEGINKVVITFSEPLEFVSATNLSNYGITTQAGVVLTVHSVALDGVGTTVTLLTGAQTAGTTYFVTLTGIKDRSEAGNVLNTTAGFVSQPNATITISWQQAASNTPHPATNLVYSLTGAGTLAGGTVADSLSGIAPVTSFGNLLTISAWDITGSVYALATNAIGGPAVVADGTTQDFLQAGVAGNGWNPTGLTRLGFHVKAGGSAGMTPGVSDDSWPSQGPEFMVMDITAPADQQVVARFAVANNNLSGYKVGDANVADGVGGNSLTRTVAPGQRASVLLWNRDVPTGGGAKRLARLTMEFTPVVRPVLNLSVTNGQAVIRWEPPVGMLQASPGFTGTWTDVTTNSPRVEPATNGSRFFRVKLP